MLRGALILQADGRYVLEMEANVEDEGHVARKITGAWEVDGDLLFMEPDEDQEAHPIDFTFILEDDRLTLRDEDEELTIILIRQ